MSRIERMERLILGILALICAQTAVAQVYKCVDERGKTHFSDQQISSCKNGAVVNRPSQPAAPKAVPTPRSTPAATSKPPQTEHEKMYFVSRCKDLKQEEA